MVIIHIAHIDPTVLGGVQMVVPQHVAAQSRYADTALLNTCGASFAGIPMLPVTRPFSLNRFPKPFDRPDLVVIHEVYRVEFLGICRELKRQGIPYIVVPHGCLTRHAQSMKRMKKTVGNVLLFRRLVASAAALQFLTEREQADSLFAEKGFVCGNGIPLPAEQKQVFRAEELHFLYIGRLDVFHKGLDLLIAATAACGQDLRQHGCRVQLFGPDLDGAHRKLRELIRANGVEDLVEVYGAVTGEEKHRLLLDADCFVQASRFEGMPLGVLEALGYGLPCLVTDGTCLDGFVGEQDAGWTCETSVESLAVALRQVISERSELAEKAARAAESCHRTFAWDVVAAATLSCYEQVMKQTE